MSTTPPMKMPPNPMATIRLWIENGMIETAKEKAELWGLKIDIRNGTIVDIGDTTDAWLNRFVTINNKMVQLKDKVRTLAKIEDEVLISGPTGTGKEIIARALHGDREGKFIAVNCAGIPETLMESTLFGHQKGAFTGAHETRQGLMHVAAKGTLFLDEIGELPLELQAKLLRAIQNKSITKVGGEKEETISCRIVSATNRNLKQMSLTGSFRIDLYARISTFELHTLGLNERVEDIRLIIESLEGGKDFISAAADRLSSLDLSLNVRSLQQYVRRFKVLGEIP